MSIFRPPAAPQVIRTGPAVLLPVVTGPTIPAGSSAAEQAVRAYRGPTSTVSQPQPPRITAPGVVVVGTPSQKWIVPQLPPVPWPYAALEQWRVGPEPAAFGGITAIRLRASPIQHPPAQPWPYAAEQRFFTMPFPGAAAPVGTPSAVPPVPRVPSAPWPYAITTLPAPASQWGIPDADLVFDRLQPVILPAVPWLHAAIQPRTSVAAFPAPVAQVLPSVVAQVGAQPWPYAHLEQWRLSPEPAYLGAITAIYLGPATLLPAAAQPWPYAAAMLAVPGVQSPAPDVVPAPPFVAAPQTAPWPYAQQRQALAPIADAGTQLPAPVTWQVPAQPWPYAQHEQVRASPEPAAFGGVTAVYGGAVPVLMGRALPFPYASTMLPVLTASEWGQAASAVFPPIGQVLSGVIYGPNGNDYTGTLVPPAGGSAYLRRR